MNILGYKIGKTKRLIAWTILGAIGSIICLVGALMASTKSEVRAWAMGFSIILAATNMARFHLQAAAGWRRLHKERESHRKEHT